MSIKRNCSIRLHTFRDIFIFPVVLLTCMFAFGQDSDIPRSISDKNISGRFDMKSSSKDIMETYAEWYNIVEKAVKTAEENGSAIDFESLLDEFFTYFNENTAESALEIYDFIKRLESDDVGKKFIDAIKNSELVPHSLNGFYPRRYIETILHGEIIFGTPDIHEYSVKDDVSTIIFGSNNNCVLRGGASHDFLFGGDGDDILRGDSGIISKNRNAIDVLAGGDGDDTYMFPDSGASFVFENNTLAAGKNRICVGAGVKPEDLYFSLSAGALYISLPWPLEKPRGAMMIANWTSMLLGEDWRKGLVDGNYDPKIVNEFPPIERIEFSTGEVLYIEDILNLLYKKRRRVTPSQEK